MSTHSCLERLFNSKAEQSLLLGSIVVGNYIHAFAKIVRHQKYRAKITEETRKREDKIAVAISRDPGIQI